MGMPQQWLDLTELTEEQVRLRVVIPLLTATPGLRSIADVHGRNEKGLDVIFLEEGTIRSRWCGLQLKRGNISGGGTGTGTVQEIVTQLGIATDLSHPVAVDGVGRIQIDQFIVAASGRISETAREEIASRVARIPVLFWDGAEIARRLRRYLPEIFSAADGVVVAYLKALIARLETLDALDGVAGVALRTLSEVYEEPAVRAKFDHAARSDIGAQPRATTIPALRIPGNTLHSVIIADQDGGKTALLRMIAIQQARQILDGRTTDGREQLPVFLHAKGLVEQAYEW